MKKKAFGIVLLVLAALVLLQGNFGIPSLGGQIWPLIGIGFFAYQSVEAILRRHFTSASFTVLVALLIANHFYAILPIPNQSLFWAGVLIVLGVSMLTHTNRTWNGKKWWYDGKKTILTDKEEIGSEGNTGLNSDYVLHYIEDLAELEHTPVRDILRASLCLSSDVNAAYDPTFADVFESRNASYINKGCVLTKYTGARGKSASNDASAETMAKVIAIMEEAGVFWQAGELGAVDVGGGGTIAKYVAHMDVDTVDLGVPILSMHSPFELASKLDVYNTYKAFKAFYA